MLSIIFIPPLVVFVLIELFGTNFRQQRMRDMRESEVRVYEGRLDASMEHRELVCANQDVSHDSFEYCWRYPA
jgi:hypothetical protein